MADLSDEQALYTTLQEAFPDATVRLDAPLQGSANRHANLQLPDGKRLFVKLFEEISGFQTERAVLERLRQSKAGLWTILPERAENNGKIAWLAYPWVELDPVELSLETAGPCGALMAALHNVPISSELVTEEPAIERVDARIERLASFPAIQERARTIWEMTHQRIEQELRRYTIPPVMLQNDFGTRNIFYRRDTQQLILIDFERAGIGDPHWELGKLWDRELYPASPIRTAFVDSYRAQRGFTAEAWPNLAVLWLIRFVATLAIFPYATRVGDTEFFEHGRFKLALVEDEAGQWRV